MIIKSLDTSARRYAKNSLRAYIEGGKYAKDKKPKNLNWLIGVIKSSGVKANTLIEIFNEMQNYPQNEEEKSRLEIAFKECQNQKFL